MPEPYPYTPKKEHFKKNVPLPPKLSIKHISKAMVKTQEIIAMINDTLLRNGVDPLTHYVQMNNFSGIVSNIFTNSMHQVSPYHNNSLNSHPDLLDRTTGIGIEIKVANRPGKGGESHNGHGGWHLIACYNLDSKSGNIQFSHIMMAELIGYEKGEVDWHFCKSTNEGGRTRHIETYYTTARGTEKLRKGSIYLDTDIVKNWNRWRI